MGSSFVLLLVCWVYVVICLPICTPNNLHISDFSNYSIWQLEGDGSFSLAFEHCEIVRVSPKNAKRCLHGSHIVFIGDSVTRYMYLSLVNFLALEKWAPSIAHVADPTYPRNPMWERILTIGQSIIMIPTNY